MKRLGLIVIIILGLSLIGTTSGQPVISEELGAKNIDLDITEIELLNDPNLSEPQVIVNEGPISEFSAVYDPPSTGANDSLLHLVWNHGLGTPLDFQSQSDTNQDLPDCNDFIYFEQSFSWNLNRIPRIVDFAVTNSITATGNFTLTSDYFEWYVWLIDSSDNFVEIFEAHPYYHSYLLRESRRISSSDLRNAWGGMVEDDEGYQEDPTDILRFAVGLAPTFAFMNYTNTIQGTVELSISDISLIWYSDSIYDYTEEPIYSFYDTPFDFGYNYINDIEVDTAGFIYAVASPSYSPYHYVYSTNLLKLDNKLNLIWKRQISAPFGSYAPALESSPDGTIYVIDSIETRSQSSLMRLTAWNSRGSLLLNKTYSFGGEFSPMDIVYSRDRSLCITGVFSNNTGGFSQGFILKCDLKGKPLWYQIGNHNARGIEIATTSNGTIYVRSYYSFISAWSPDGYSLWNETYLLGDAIAVDSNDNLYITNDYLGGEIVTKLSSNGTQVWNSTWGSIERYQLMQYAYCIDIAATPHGQSYVIGQTQNQFPFLVKRTSNGSISSIWTWDIYGWGWSSHPLELGNGLIYICGSAYDEASESSVGAIFAFSDPEIVLNVVDTTMVSLLVVSISTVGVCTIVILGFEKKWFEALHSKLRIKISQSVKKIKEDEGT